MEVSGQLHAPVALPPGRGASGTLWLGGWVGPRTGLDDLEERKFLTLSGLELRFLGRPARSQSLYDYAIPAPRYKGFVPKRVKMYYTWFNPFVNTPLHLHSFKTAKHIPRSATELLSEQMTPVT
jgi:hypothetical protein